MLVISYSNMDRDVIERLKEKIPPKSAFIVCSNPVAVMSSDVDYRFRQNSNMYYLTGFEEPHSVAVFRFGQSPESVLFVQPRDKDREIWDGFRAGTEGATEKYGADMSYPIDSLSKELPLLLQTCEEVYFPLSQSEFDNDFLTAYKTAQHNNRRYHIHPHTIREPDFVLNDLRKIKNKDELNYLRKSVSIASEAHIEAIQACKPGMYEFEIEAILKNKFFSSGALYCSYPPICASGPNATILHYIENKRKMENGDLLLVDAGCTYQYYASDITRTYPVNGVFSDEQREIYSLVLKAQKASIESVRVGNTFLAPHETTLKILTQGLIDLDLLKGDVNQIIENGEYSKFYMHGTSHYLGIDVHDPGATKISESEGTPLKEGMVLTIEPGLYFDPSDNDIPEAYRGIGIRIEDDVLVSKMGPDILSSQVPKEIDEIEKMMS